MPPARSTAAARFAASCIFESLRRILSKCAVQESNLPPTPRQGVALPNELTALRARLNITAICLLFNAYVTSSAAPAAALLNRLNRHPRLPPVQIFPTRLPARIRRLECSTACGTSLRVRVILHACRRRQSRLFPKRRCGPFSLLLKAGELSR